jgi:hypothetical protein
MFPRRSAPVFGRRRLGQGDPHLFVWKLIALPQSIDLKTRSIRELSMPITASRKIYEPKVTDRRVGSLKPAAQQKDKEENVAVVLMRGAGMTVVLMRGAGMTVVLMRDAGMTVVPLATLTVGITDREEPVFKTRAEAPTMTDGMIPPVIKIRITLKAAVHTVGVLPTTDLMDLPTIGTDQQTRAEMLVVAATTLIATHRTARIVVGISITTGHQVAIETATLRIAREIEIPDEATAMGTRIVTEAASHKIAKTTRLAILITTAHQTEATTRGATEVCNGMTFQTATVHQVEATTRTAAQA